MSDTTSLPDQPVSPGTVRTAPISEPAWLKSAASSLMQSNTQPETSTPSIPRPIQEESESVGDAEESELQSQKVVAPPPPLSTYSLLTNEKALKDVHSPLASPASPAAAAAPAAATAPAALSEPTIQTVDETTSAVKVEGMQELTDQISYLVQRISRLEKLALNGGHDDVRSVRSVSEFPLDVLKSKTGKRYLPTSRSVFLTYFSHQKNATNRSA